MKFSASPLKANLGNIQQVPLQSQSTMQQRMMKLMCFMKSTMHWFKTTTLWYSWLHLSSPYNWWQIHE